MVALRSQCMFSTRRARRIKASMFMRIASRVSEEISHLWCEVRLLENACSASYVALRSFIKLFVRPDKSSRT